MLKIGRHTLQPRAFIILVALLILILGGCMYDKQAQGGTAGQTAQAVQPEGGYHDILGQDSRGKQGTDEGTGLPQTETPGSEPTNAGLTTVKLPEHGNNAKVEETRSPSLLTSRGGGWPDSRLPVSLFDTVGQEYKVTAYTAGYESTGKRPDDKLYGITYSGKKVQEDHTIAADLSILPLGTKVLIEGLDNVYTVEDKGDAVKGNHIDLYIPELKEAQDWGVQYRRILILEMGAG